MTTSLCSFSDRIMISDPTLRNLIKLYVKKGLTEEEIANLFRLCQSKYAFLMALMNHLETQSTFQRVTSGLHQCPPPWRDFLHAIGSSSPVCALLQPTENSKILIDRLCNEDMLTDPEVYSHAWYHDVSIVLYVSYTCRE